MFCPIHNLIISVILILELNCEQVFIGFRIYYNIWLPYSVCILYSKMFNKLNYKIIIKLPQIKLNGISFKFRLFSVPITYK